VIASVNLVDNDDVDPSCANGIEQLFESGPLTEDTNGWTQVFAPFEIVYARDECFQLRESTNNFGDRRWALSLPESEKHHVTQFH
jgi:hypothetical protein